MWRRVLAKVVTKEHPNFYENFDEANIRLLNTVVIYDDMPHAMVALAPHKDGIIRAYMEVIGSEKGPMSHRAPNWPGNYPDPTARGGLLDAWMEANPKEPLIRKMLNSPKFNKFRPFALGMMNYGDKVVFVERVPQRHTQQGLTAAHVSGHVLSLNTPLQMRQTKLGAGDIYKPYFRDCVLAQHPTAKDCLKNLADPDIANEGVAFSRNFAFIRGPVDTMYLAYKTDIIGHLPTGDLSEVRISRKFAHTKEAVEEIKLFRTIKTM